MVSASAAIWAFRASRESKTDLVPQVLEKLHPQRLAVQVALKVQQAGLHGDVAAAFTVGRVPTLVTAA